MKSGARNDGCGWPLPGSWQGLSKVATNPVILSEAKNLATWERSGAEFTLSGAERLRAGPWLEPGVTRVTYGKTLGS